MSTKKTIKKRIVISEEQFKRLMKHLMPVR